MFKAFGLPRRASHLHYLNNAERVERLVAEICSSGGDAQAVQSDVRDKEQTNYLIKKVNDTYQHIDIVVSSAPAGWVEKSFREISREEYRSVVICR
jgi:3-oxoacyl-[acyl-carrier protein] reductase